MDMRSDIIRGMASGDAQNNPLKDLGPAVRRRITSAKSPNGRWQPDLSTYCQVTTNSILLKGQKYKRNQMGLDSVRVLWELMQCPDSFGPLRIKIWR
ncbi:hypothetical protein AVEN_203280-1 [Araneus ventricosus]|nr:hypothetical protein AVEN_143985-1 [Araneus ventricosus]GBO28597.1 hypothetical protein AVEN_187290-1 [Araneus ventricosus]GBO28721.1 hypothetical protein AVEN_161542-1 [Araneus ventricosus]GBO28722.1 hypothetical protein AVEN_203280-1 [Araneus ventricosus]